jgi:hypothetical protein
MDGKLLKNNTPSYFVEKQYPQLLQEIHQVIAGVDESVHLTKESEEKTMKGEMLYAPGSLNDAFKEQFRRIGGWGRMRVKAEYSVKSQPFLAQGYAAEKANRNAYREMDFLKEKLGVEVQFGKYAFMVYNVCGKMTIFNKLGHIDAGVEIVPMKKFAAKMSTGVSYFEQFVWDLETRGVSNLDIPVLILGIGADWEKTPVQTLPEQIVEKSQEAEPQELL